ncbi:MAG: DUF58 domain-containing protein [Anaerolineales bacterium]|nr:DUF58 domain-containing protein [Anaerolineales bacterium]MCB8940063.1 DUF58 domain-containing protein [Ardenticatenaceae bacterium]
MSQNFEQIHLVMREKQRETMMMARRNIIDAAVTGRGVSAQDTAQARGLVIRERENSIFSDAWVPLAVIFLIIGLTAGRQGAMVALGLALLLIVGVSAVWKNLSLLGVTYERRFNRNRVFPGEPIEMTITVGNDKLLPLTWLHFRDELPVVVEEEDALAQVTSEMNGRYLLLNSFSLYGREQTERTYTLRFAKRGYYKLGPVTYESGDIFTLFTRQRDHYYIDQLIIFPKIYPLDELGLPAKEPFGEVKVQRSLFTDPIKTQGVRDYQPGDRFRDVHWKATAVRGNLQTKLYDPSTGMTIAVFLNVATFPRHWMGFDPELLERAVSVAGSIANYGVEQGWAAGIYANGSVPNADQPIRVQPGRSPEQLAHILQALAAVTEFATASIEKMMLRTSPSLPWASTIVLVTAVVTEEIMVALVRLKEAGRRVVLISLAEEPPPKGLGNILSYHIPASVAAFQKENSATEAALGMVHEMGNEQVNGKW